MLFSKIKNSNHFFKNKEKELTIEVEKYIKEKTGSYLKSTISPPTVGFLQPVVLGKDIGIF